MAEPTIDDAIKENALGPAEASTAAGRVKSQKIDDQIRGKRFDEDGTAATRNHRGLRFTKLKHGGTV